MLHVPERVAQLADFVDAVALGQNLVEIPSGDGLRLTRKRLEGFQLARDDAERYHQEQKQSEADSQHDSELDAVEAAEDIALWANDCCTPAGISQRLIEYVAVFTIYFELLHALLAAEHGVAQFRECLVLMV